MDTVTVTGVAMITVDIMNQTRPGSPITSLEPTAIKLQIPEMMGGHTLSIALYDLTDNSLVECSYKTDAIFNVIDLSNIDVAGHSLRAFVWENDTIVPTDLTTDYYYCD